MVVDAQKLAQQMLSAALPILKRGAVNAEPLATLEFLKLAVTILATSNQVGAGQLNPLEGAAVLDVQKGASRSVLLGLPGLTLMTVEQAINAGYGVARKAVGAGGVAGIVGPWPP